MNKKLFFCLLTLVLSFFACDKNGKTDSPPGNTPTSAEFNYAPCWSVVGSAGTIDGNAEGYILGTPIGIFFPPTEDPLSFNLLNLSHDGVASIRGENTNASIRYNVSYIPERRPYGKILQVRYLVNDKQKQRLIVILKKYRMQGPPNPEAAEVVKIFDSNNFPASPTFQTQYVDIQTNNEFGIFDFANNAFFLEAMFIRTSSGGGPGTPQIPVQSHQAPALGMISICDPPVK